MSTTTAHPQTLAQKLIARAAGMASVTPGEIVICKVDLAMIHDSGGPRRVAPLLAELGAKVWDPARVVVVTDHYVPATDDASRRIVAITRDWVRDAGVPHFHDGEGICHVVLPERGHLRPGMFAVGGDSHSPTGGAFGAYMFGVGATEMAAVLATGEIWLRVPQTIRMRFEGALGAGLSAKDMMLMLIGRFGLNGARYEALEYCGAAVRALPMPERMTLANMSAELGAQAGLIAADDTTLAALRAAGVPDVALAPLAGDDDASAAQTHVFDATTLVPQVAAPHSPANVRAVTEAAGTRVSLAYIGACTGAKLSDLRMAARVLQGRRVAEGVTLLVAPASARELSTAQHEGTMDTLRAAGARVLGIGCGACAGYGADTLTAGTVAISSTARNFKGRMGSADAEVWLGSPYTVAASALTGRITDPRTVLA